MPELASGPMQFAYADPPYVGMAHRYPEHEEVDQPALIAKMDAEYDGWALSCSVPSLRELLPVCPEGVRVLSWCKTWSSWKPGNQPAYAWEPVLLKGLPRKHSRKNGDLTVRDWMACAAHQVGFFGSKPLEFSLWLFACARLKDGDDFEDLFPGTGGVTRAWERYCAQGILVG